MPISADLFREVFRRWPSGVAIVTSIAGDHRHGMVVGSFCSLSSDPPLVMFSAGTATRTHGIVAESGIFAISILSEEHEDLFARFAGFDRTYDDDRFAGLATHPAVTGAPTLPDAVAWVDCRVVAQHPGENYTIFVGEVVEASLGAAAEKLPLVYFRRQIRRLANHLAGER